MTVNLAAGGPNWVTLAGHRAWLLGRAEELFAVFDGASLNPLGGFFDMDAKGRPFAAGLPPDKPRARQIHVTTRMVHSFAIAHLMGRPGADRMIDHGMRFLWEGHRDPVHGGYYWGVGDQAPTDDSKQAYGHAFVLLAASSAKVAGHPDADRLLADISEVLKTRFWEARHGAFAEEFTRDWRPLSNYRGQNSNMHLTEATMAAFEATGERFYLDMAESIAERIIAKAAAGNGWRLPEHFDANWQVDLAYSGDRTFRPYGSTPGHWLEWARLLVQLYELGGRRQGWMPEAAKALFAQAAKEGWDASTGGFYYTIEWDGSPRIRDRYWWPAAEGVGAAYFLGALTGDPLYEQWYRRVWNWVAAHLVARDGTGWHPQVNDAMVATTGPFYGRPDIYHSLQACLIPLLPATGSVTRGLVAKGI